MASHSPRQQPLSAVLPPLLLGTATFNTQYVDDPAAMPYRRIVRRALDLGVAGFDTSPYYGPSEELLGEALAASGADRASYFLETKAGRVHSHGFDYSAAAVTASVRRSLQRLRTSYLDLVFCHDAEFVSAGEVLEAVQALRALRAEGVLRYVGISGFPVDVLATLAETILAETGEPVDAVLSYGHGTVQNTLLLRAAPRFAAAGVSVVLNASLLNMGLLTTRGVDNGPQATWHPSPAPLREASVVAARICTERASAGALFGMKGIEQVALRYALDVWARRAAEHKLGTVAAHGNVGVGPSVLGVTTEQELDETVVEWWSVLDALGVPHPSPSLLQGKATATTPEESLQRTEQVRVLVEDTLWPVFGEWKDFAWASPDEGWVNQLKQ